MASNPSSTYTAAELMMHVISRTIDDGDILALGNFTPLAYGSCLLAKMTHAPNAVLIAGAGLDTPPYRITLATSGGLGAMFVSLWFGHTLIHQVGITAMECLSAAQIDMKGRLNTTLIGDPAKPTLRLPGGAGQGDTGITCHKYVVYTARHNPRVLVSNVDFVTGERYFVSEAERQLAGLKPGVSRLVTNLCVFDLSPATREFELVSIHPGHSREEVKQATGWPIGDRDVGVTEPPNDQELSLIRTQIDPLGLLPLESLPGKDRLQHLYQAPRQGTRLRGSVQFHRLRPVSRVTWSRVMPNGDARSKAGRKRAGHSCWSLH